LRDGHPWGAPQGEQSKFRKTDILIIASDVDSGERLGIHVENKRSRGAFTDGRQEDYPLRAAAWAGIEKWGNYQLWHTVLAAPRAFLDLHLEQDACFDSMITHGSRMTTSQHSTRRFL
jgi:hypothetical protein